MRSQLLEMQIDSFWSEADLRLPLNLRLDCGGCRCDRLAWGQNAGLHVGFGSLVPSVHEAAIFLLGRLEMKLRNVTYCPPVARVCKDKTGKINDTHPVTILHCYIGATWLFSLTRWLQ